MEEMNDLIEALIKAQSEIEHASKDGNNPYFKSGYATLEKVITTVKKPLNDNGIYFQQHTHNIEDGVCVETVFYGHGAKLETGMVTIPTDRTPQGRGSGLTYAKRYSLSLACGIGHQKDDDANLAEDNIAIQKENEALLERHLSKFDDEKMNFDNLKDFKAYLKTNKRSGERIKGLSIDSYNDMIKRIEAKKEELEDKINQVDEETDYPQQQ
tara:strand:+ start:4894 stop:5529 length:636 start_codon:yes stop_codon:yes gene_type:complete